MGANADVENKKNGVKNTEIQTVTKLDVKHKFSYFFQISSSCMLEQQVAGALVKFNRAKNKRKIKKTASAAAAVVVAIANNRHLRFGRLRS